jgi:serine/threonine protein kinase
MRASNERRISDVDRLEQPELCDAEAASLGFDLGLLEIGGLIGEGSSAHVFRGVYSGDVVAVKQLSFREQTLCNGEADEESRKNRFSHLFSKEASILAVLRHPNVVHFYGAAYNPRKHCGYLVTELCTKGSLQSHLYAGSPEVGRDRFFSNALGIANGMAFFHEKKLVHRDLKPANVLLSTDSVVKLCDFGLSRFVKDTGRQDSQMLTMTAGVGTPGRWVFHSAMYSISTGRLLV